MQIPTNVLALVFVLSVLIVLHEWGHFAVAKYFGFPVEVFSLGFEAGWLMDGAQLLMRFSFAF